jgi:predicted deacetylase
MTEARYLIRLDDSCPTQDRKKWNNIEVILSRRKIKAIIAVVPDNKDATLCCDAPNEEYWEQIRSLQKKGWAIALHGCHHEYVSTPASSSLIPLYNRSEFAGKDLTEQARLIKHGYKILKNKGIIPTVWVAPSHTFDENTIRAIVNETDIRIVSDGFSIWPKNFNQIQLIPQQLWWPEKKAAGIWTICLHPNEMTDTDFEKLEETLNDDYKFITIEEATNYCRDETLHSYMWRFSQLLKWRIKRIIFNRK